MRVFRWLGMLAGALSLLLLLQRAFDFGLASPVQAMLDNFVSIFDFAITFTRLLDSIPGPFSGWWQATALMAIAVFAGWREALLAKQVKESDVIQFAVITAVLGGAGFYLGGADPAGTSIFAAVSGAFAQLVLRGIFSFVYPNAESESVVGKYVLTIMALMLAVVLPSIALYVASDPRFGWAPTDMRWQVRAGAAVAVTLLAVGAYYLMAALSRGYVQNQGIDWGAVTRSSSYQLGMRLTSMVIGTLLFLVTNAGLKLAGL